MRKFKISSEMQPWVANVLKRERIPCKINDDNIICVPISGRMFHEKVQQAGIERDVATRVGLSAQQLFQNKKLCGIPVFNRHILSNTGRKQRLLKQYNRTGCIVSASDADWYLTHCI